MLTTYLPSILLMLITYATTFFKPFFFEAALTVNLTNMLVMTTLFIGVMQSLPTTAYVKMIDIWLIGCQVLPFTEVVLLTAMEYYRDEDDIEEPPTNAATQTDTGSGSHKQGTTTINHHGRPRVVKLGGWTSKETGPVVQICTVPDQQDLPVTMTTKEEPAHQAGKEGERQQWRKYLNMTKYFGKSFRLAASSLLY
jgi:hypothetical protein